MNDQTLSHDFSTQVKFSSGLLGETCGIYYHVIPRGDLCGGVGYLPAIKSLLNWEPVTILWCGAKKHVRGAAETSMNK